MTSLYSGASVNIYVAAENAGSRLDGFIDEIAIFDRALTATEILNMYNDGVDGASGGND